MDMDHTATIITGKVSRGTLPRSTHASASLGQGNGQLCNGCDKAVAGANTEVVVGFTGGPALRFHLDCFGVWRAAARAASGSGGKAKPPGTAALRART